MAAVLSEPDADAGNRSPAARPDPELFIVMNRGSGATTKEDARDAIEAELTGAGRRYRFVPVAPGQILQACQEAARQARAAGGVVVAAGGDGTINCAAQSALAQDCPLGIIALGTFNLFARQLGLPLAPGEAARAILGARPEPVQVGWVNQRAFLVNASAGMYPKLLADREQIKQKLGRRRWIAMLAALKSLLEWRVQLVLDAELDGQVTQLRTASVFVCNNRLQLQRLGIDQEVVAEVGEGRLAGLLLPELGVWDKLRMVAAAALGRLGEEPEISSFSFRSLTVAARRARRIRIAFDGEVQWMELPVRFTVAPRPLQVMLPPPEQRLPVR